MTPAQKARLAAGRARARKLRQSLAVDLPGGWRIAPALMKGRRVRSWRLSGHGPPGYFSSLVSAVKAYAKRATRYGPV